MKKAKYIISFGFFVSLLIVVSGCQNVLDEKLYSSVPVTGFYKTADQAQLALNGVYAELWNAIYKDALWMSMTDVPGGTLASYPSTGNFDNFSWTVSDRAFQDMWERTYEAINRANTLLDKLQDADIGAAQKANISGQAKFLRALFYFDMVQIFGGVPLYIHGTSDLSNVDMPRNTSDEVYQQIIKDLTDAAQELSPYSESDHSAGKANSGAALGLLAKVYAQQQDWSNAAETAKKVMDMGVFKLFPDYEQVLDPAYNNGEEKLFSIQHGNGGDPTSNLGEHLVYIYGPPPTTTPDGINAVFFHTSKGVGYQANQSFFDTTPNTYRKWMSMRDKMPYYYPVGSYDLVYKTIPLDAPFIFKFNHLDKSSGDLMTGVQLPIVRYSDVLLTYAEAVNEANNGPTAEAYDAINQVRARARGVGTPNEQPESVYPPLAGLDQAAFRDAVLTEEAREFVGEGHRRQDLLRHDMFISDAKSRGKNASDFQKVYPIPVEEIAINQNLVQNDGYTQ